jgi:hypothetical protein
VVAVVRSANSFINGAQGLAKTRRNKEERVGGLEEGGRGNRDGREGRASYFFFPPAAFWAAFVTLP